MKSVNPSDVKRLRYFASRKNNSDGVIGLVTVYKPDTSTGDGVTFVHVVDASDGVACNV